MVLMRDTIDLKRLKEILDGMTIVNSRSKKSTRFKFIQKIINSLYRTDNHNKWYHKTRIVEVSRINDKGEEIIRYNLDRGYIFIPFLWVTVHPYPLTPREINSLIDTLNSPEEKTKTRVISQREWKNITVMEEL